MIDEFASRFVYFYTGYVLAPVVFALANNSDEQVDRLDKVRLVDLDGDDLSYVVGTPPANGAGGNVTFAADNRILGGTASAGSNVTIDNLTVDTDRDGIDLDCCRNVRVANCIVNAHKDDAICLKSSYALNRRIMCEDVTVIGCKTSGYALGSVLDGSYRLERIGVSA